MRRLTSPTGRAAWVLVAMMIASCAGSAAKSETAGPLSALRHNVDPGVGASHQAAATLVDLLPNAKAGDGTALSDSVVVGQLADVAPGDGFVESGEGPTPGRPSATRTSFSDAHASWRTLRLTVSVTSVLAGPRFASVELDWPLLGSARQGEDADRIGRELRSLGRVLVISQAVPAGAEYAGLKRQIPDRQHGLGVVGSDGALSFPLIAGDSGTTAAAWMGGVDTLAELRAAAAGPARRRDS
jgi:hypothetical protein